MHEKKLLEIFQLVQKQTDAGKLEWQQGVGNRYRVILPQFAIELKFEGSPAELQMSVIDNHGNLLGSVDAQLIKGNSVLAYYEASKLLDDLYAKARSQALKIEVSLDALISELKSDEK